MRGNSSNIKRFRGGFSFAEVMFAVVILGVGFILIAAIFPVATEQIRSTNDEAAAAHIARAAVQIIRSSTINEDFTDTAGAVVPFSDLSPLWDKVSGNVINAADARYAWIPFYSRTGNGLVQVTVLVVRRWTRDNYTAQDLAGDLHPRGIGVISIIPRGDGTAIAQISKEDPFGMYKSVTDGCLLVMRSSNVAGRTFRVSKIAVEDASTISYVLAPGDGGSISESFDSAPMSAAVVGRDFIDPSWDNTDLTNPNAGYTGPSQDLAVYSTFFSPS